MQLNSMTKIIYDYFASRIKFGYFVKGDRLPSIQNICSQHGYIETYERKPPTVIFEPDEQSELEYLLYFLSHIEGMTDICRSSGLIFDPVMCLYFQRQDQASIKQIRSKFNKRLTVQPAIPSHIYFIGISADLVKPHFSH